MTIAKTTAAKRTASLLVVMAGVVLLTGSARAAGEVTETAWEFQATFGYTFSEGAEFAEPVTPPGDTRTFVKAGPVSSISYGAAVNYIFHWQSAIGFQWNQQDSKLGLDQEFVAGNVEVTDLAVNNYHGTFTYFFTQTGQGLVPFIYGGLGATNFSPGSFMGAQLRGQTEFSTTWGGGANFYTAGHLALKGVARWTPTFVKSEPGSVWCGAFGCTQSSRLDYAHQFEMAVGLIFRL